MSDHPPAAGRYDAMPYRRCGTSGLLPSAVSFGYWHSFGAGADFADCRAMTLRVFDLGITNLAFSPAEIEAIDRASQPTE